MAGKGDRDRTSDRAAYREGWDRAFGHEAGVVERIGKIPRPGRVTDRGLVSGDNSVQVYTGFYETVAQYEP